MADDDVQVVLQRQEQSISELERQVAELRDLLAKR